MTESFSKISWQEQQIESRRISELADLAVRNVAADSAQGKTLGYCDQDTFVTAFYGGIIPAEDETDSERLERAAKDVPEDVVKGLRALRRLTFAHEEPFMIARPRSHIGLSAVRLLVHHPYEHAVGGIKYKLRYGHHLLKGNVAIHNVRFLPPGGPVNEELPLLHLQRPNSGTKVDSTVNVADNLAVGRLEVRERLMRDGYDPKLDSKLSERIELLRAQL